MREGLHYNPYFPGGAIAMPKMLADGGTEYEDETPATESQQAKVLDISGTTASAKPCRRPHREQCYPLLWLCFVVCGKVCRIGFASVLRHAVHAEIVRASMYMLHKVDCWVDSRCTILLAMLCLHALPMRTV